MKTFRELRESLDELLYETSEKRMLGAIKGRVNQTIAYGKIDDYVVATKAADRAVRTADYLKKKKGGKTPRYSKRYKEAPMIQWKHTGRLARGTNDNV